MTITSKNVILSNKSIPEVYSSHSYSHRSWLFFCPAILDNVPFRNEGEEEEEEEKEKEEEEQGELRIHHHRLWKWVSHPALSRMSHVTSADGKPLPALCNCGSTDRS
ncbi:hypothetical protein LOAG_03186 [Loa loa]|uniref:Uncharacterized protein n=1 Tax=Loa loa TaxID=7209 RepID=A0A1S0U5B5_LOALO|nr:hypothetical protein LOAG_03186 [Loa loa]EFO25294.1 hypothetical protein LOAG_03186 [Loa loa]